MTEYIYRGAIENLEHILDKEKSKKILVFTGKKSFEKIKPIITSQLKKTEYIYFSDFSTNPKADEIEKSIELLGNSYDIFIAIGGGSVIDFAKMYRFRADNQIKIRDYFKNKISIEKKHKLVAIPTTCGTGSESTQFAVLYIDNKKYSFDDKSVLPDYAIADSQFTDNNPQYLKACTTMDAYAQAIESYWAVKSTNESRLYAKQAIELCRDNIIQYVTSNNKIASDNMMKASHLSGKAINISRTTASHALSYGLTTKYNIPHGHAVALSLPQLMEFNHNIDINSLNDNRGVDFVKQRIKELYEIIGITTPKDYFHNLFEQINLEIDLKKLKIDNINSIIEEVDLNRLENNPQKLSQKELSNIFKADIQ